MVQDAGGMVHVVAELSFAPESREAFLGAFRRLEPLVRASKKTQRRRKTAAKARQFRFEFVEGARI